MNQTDIFQEYQPLLRGIAYRMLGSMTDAEDMVQETWLRHHAKDGEVIREPKAWLCKVLVNLCLDHMKSAGSQREHYLGPWLPEPLADGPSDKPERATLDYALLVTMERLNPMERAVFLLNEVFAFRFAEIAEMLDLQTDHCRQLAHRAKKQVTRARPRFDVDSQVLQGLSTRFYQALGSGELAPLLDLFQRDIVLYADGGNRIAAARRPLHGPDRVARFWRGIYAKMVGVRWEMQWIAQTPVWVLFQGDAPILFVGFAGDSSGISALYLVRNPDKLTNLKPRVCQINNS